MSTATTDLIAEHRSIAAQQPLAEYGLRPVLRRIFLGVLLLMSNRVFEYYPNVRPVEEAWFVLSLLAFVTIYPALKISLDWTFTKFELYLLILMPVLLLLPAISAWNEFGQPVWYGILAQRAVVLIATWIIFLNVWRRGWIRLDEVKLVLINLVWITFVIYVFIRLALNPQNYPVPGFVNGVGEADASFNPPNIILIFGTIYYGLMAIRQRSLKYYAYTTALFLNALGSSGRSLSVCLLATFLYFLARWRPIEQVLIAIGKFLLVIAFAAGIFFVVNPKLLIERSSKYAQAISVVLGASEVEDSSANARLIESSRALPFVQRHPLIGAGLLSSQWNGGFRDSQIIGGYFYPDDIGILGVIFGYGILGSLVLAIQFVFAFQVGARIPKDFADPMLDGVKGFLFCCGIFSISSGLFAFEAEAIVFFIILLTMLYENNRTQIDASRQASPALPSGMAQLSRT